MVCEGAERAVQLPLEPGNHGSPITDADDERLDLEIGWRLPRAKDLQDSLLCIFARPRNPPNGIDSEGLGTELTGRGQRSYRCIGEKRWDLRVNCAGRKND